MQTDVAAMSAERVTAAVVDNPCLQVMGLLHSRRAYPGGENAGRAKLGTMRSTLSDKLTDACDLTVAYSRPAAVRAPKRHLTLIVYAGCRRDGN